MVNQLLIGFLMGILAGLGVGGGSLLILWLTLVQGVSAADARWINLAFFLTAAGAESVLRFQKGVLAIKELLPAMIAGSIGAAFSSVLRGFLPPQWLEKAFGVLLLVTGVRELFYRPRKAK